MSKVTSREYKFMLDHRMFTSRKAAIAALWDDVRRIAGNCRTEIKGEFGRTDKRTIQFMDTSDFTLRRNGLILRLRRNQAEQAGGEYTLKCRMEDRYVADAKDLTPGRRLKGKRKFEEDIATPFRSRFSQSMSVTGKAIERPLTIGNAARSFPILGALTRDGAICDGSTPLAVVGGFTPHERVIKGPVLRLARGCPATIAIILWSSAWKERPVCAEFSFRYENEQEKFPPDAAEAAFNLFAALQSTDWCLPGGMTKTQFAYGG